MVLPAIDAWRDRGRMVDTVDGQVFTVRVDGPSDRTPVLALHGFPTSSWDFARCLDALRGRRVVAAFDFLGFGLSARPRRFAYSLVEQADVTLAVARALGLTRVHLWAHDMGTSVATELLARRARGLLPLELASVTLMNGSVHQEMARITASQRVLKSPLGPLLARAMNRVAFRRQMRAIFAAPPPDDNLDVMWALLARDDGARNMPAIARYMVDRVRFEGRWIGALERLDLPAHVAWGRRDPVARPAIAEQLAREIPGAKLTWWDALGHYPQVESPERVTASLSAFWDDVDRATPPAAPAGA